jgi:hypothetical protein
MALYFGIATLSLFTADDATGTQTCHNVAVPTTRMVPFLVTEFKDTEPGSSFFIPTNLRGDSTLRRHLHLKSKRLIKYSDQAMHACAFLEM